MKTVIHELLDLIPSGQEIKQVIFDNDMDGKMLDDWLWERLYKGNNWIKKERKQMIDFNTEVIREGFEAENNDNDDTFSEEDEKIVREEAAKYYKKTYNKPLNK